VQKDAQVLEKHAVCILNLALKTEGLIVMQNTTVGKSGYCQFYRNIVQQKQLYSVSNCCLWLFFYNYITKSYSICIRVITLNKNNFSDMLQLGCTTPHPPHLQQYRSHNKPLNNTHLSTVLQIWEKCSIAAHNVMNVPGNELSLKNIYIYIFCFTKSISGNTNILLNTILVTAVPEFVQVLIKIHLCFM